MTNIVEIYTDGACSGNPGPGGWGVFIKHKNNNVELSGGERETTNNRMELMAAIKALEYFDNKNEIILYTDSNYVKDGITKWISNWKKNNWKTSNKKPVKNKDLWIRLDEAISKKNINWQWVKGHAGNEGNEQADYLARSALEKL
ncbi:MAG: ribonuclease HI [Pseudomonadota bacterium]|nr:ribonuclease HI [Pseudomonadota bacterium]MEC9458975.1 ribonuclease HI [Pseudomonadota bacterium]MEC9481266.1 ribonuclease HI [Pseudomonadota bacterium]